VARNDRESALKRRVFGVENPRVKVCPGCEAENRDSVIRCTTCGATFPAGSRNAARADAHPGAASTAVPWAQGAPHISATAVETSERTTVPGPSRNDRSSVWSTPAATLRPPTATASALPTTHSGPDANARRALPTTSRTSNRPDAALLLAALVAAAAAYMAWGAITMRWMQITIGDTQEGVARTFGTATFRASDAMIGTLAQIVVIVIAAGAMLWFFFGLQRGWTMPWFSTPAIGIVAAVTGIAATFVSSFVWFVWRDAVFAAAERYGETASRLRRFLDDPDHRPSITLHRLAATQRFITMLAIALAASCIAWWAYRRRAE
jgi:hypothetical protein